MIDKLTKKHPRVKVVATTLGEVHSTNRHSWDAVAWINVRKYQPATAELDVYDRVGGGDRFSGTIPKARLGARRTAHDFSWGHHYGDAAIRAGYWAALPIGRAPDVFAHSGSV